MISFLLISFFWMPISSEIISILIGNTMLVWCRENKILSSLPLLSLQFPTSIKNVSSSIRYVVLKTDRTGTENAYWDVFPVQLGFLVTTGKIMQFKNHIWHYRKINMWYFDINVARPSIFIVEFLFLRCAGLIEKAQAFSCASLC